MYTWYITRIFIPISTQVSNLKKNYKLSSSKCNAIYYYYLMDEGSQKKKWHCIYAMNVENNRLSLLFQ